MIPLYIVVLALDIKNSLFGPCFVYAGLGVSMAVFSCHCFVKGIPEELVEAAAIDGSTLLQTFFGFASPTPRRAPFAKT